MPKMKTHKGLAKRVKITGNGKVKHKKGGLGHLSGHMSSKRRSNLSSPSFMSAGFAKKAKLLLRVS